MNKFIGMIFLLAFFMINNSAYGQDLQGRTSRKIATLDFHTNGLIEFILLASSRDMPSEKNNRNEFICNIEISRVKLYIQPCINPTQICLAASNRLASMLLSAKLSGRKVRLTKNNCEVTNVRIY